MGLIVDCKRQQSSKLQNRSVAIIWMWRSEGDRKKTRASGLMGQYQKYIWISGGEVKQNKWKNKGKKNPQI